MKKAEGMTVAQEESLRFLRDPPPPTILMVLEDEIKNLFIYVITKLGLRK